MKILLLFLLLSKVIQSFNHLTTFDFVGTFQCNHPGLWCIELWYRELDNSENTHDDYGKVKWSCTYSPTRTIFHGATDTDDGEFNFHYEPEVTITHNCSNDIYVKFHHQFQDVPVILQYIRLDYAYDITN